MSLIYTAERQCQHRLLALNVATCTAIPVSIRRDKLTRDSLRNILAVGSLLAAAHVDIRPGPVGAATLATLDVDIDCILIDRSCDVLEHEILDRNAIRGLTLNTVVRLGHDNAVVGVVSRAVDDDIAVGNV